MNTYYEILGLQPGASQTEIKRAYFRLIRLHSPESDPEQFQKIREAYEQLKNVKNAPQGPEFPPLGSPQAQLFMKEIEEYRQRQDSIGFRDACEEAWHLFPNDIQFLYLLIIAQRQCGNTGKAVKNSELLVSKDPGNLWFQRELAFSYLDRGFTKKAFRACEKAYELGCREPEFISMYSLECNTYGEFDRGVEILLDMIRQKERWSKEEIPDLVNAYTGLTQLSVDAKKEHLPEILDHLYRTVEQYGVYMTGYIFELAGMVSYLSMDKRAGAEEYRKIGQILDKLEKSCPSGSSEADMIDKGRDLLYYQRLQNDSRIGDTFTQCFKAQITFEKKNEKLGRYLLLDSVLCMLEEREEILEQAEILRQDYPGFHEKIQPFLSKLESPENLPVFKARLQKEYMQLASCFDDFGDGQYFQKYPQEQRNIQGTVIHDWEDPEPYVRSSKKVGRNDPCPCGSGKKYKHCCMNK